MLRLPVIARRVRFVWSVLVRPWYLIVSALVGVVGNVDTVLAHLPSGVRYALPPALLQFSVPPWLWISVLSILFVVAIVEGAYRRVEGSTERHLELVFGGDRPPYVQDILRHDGMRDRRYRVGIVNRGSAPITTAEVVLQMSQPPLDFGGHRFQQMGRGFVFDTILVNPSDQPTAFVDIICEWSDPGGPYRQWRLLYVTDHGVFEPPIDQREYVLALRVNGAPMPEGIALRVYPNADGRLTVEEIVHP